jgi:hypothetical protein
MLATVGLVISFFVGLTLLGVAAVSAIAIALVLAIRGRKTPSTGYFHHDFGTAHRQQKSDQQKSSKRFDTVIDLEAIRVK